MTHPALIERITRSLAYMLRHQPERFELELDSHGFSDVDEVVRAVNEALGERVDLEDIEEAIESGDRPRYEIVDERIRALYGHSIQVEPGETSKPPELLYIGIRSRDGERALSNGLRSGRRRFLHLALSEDEGRESGRRAGPDYSVIAISALDAWEEGINFYDRRSLFLAEAIPTQFLELTGSYEDGYEQTWDSGRSDGGHAREAGGGRDRSSRRGGRGRRAESRGPGREQGPRSERSERPERPERPERSERSEHPVRAERPERAERPDRPEGARRDRPGDREGRERSNQGDDQERRERAPRRREEEEHRPAVERSSSSRPRREPRPAEKGDFGGGIFNASKEIVARRSEEPRESSREIERPRPATEPAAERKPAEPSKPVESRKSSGPGFGSGL